MHNWKRSKYSSVQKIFFSCVFIYFAIIFRFRAYWKEKHLRSFCRSNKSRFDKKGDRKVVNMVHEKVWKAITTLFNRHRVLRGMVSFSVLWPGRWRELLTSYLFSFTVNSIFLYFFAINFPIYPLITFPTSIFCSRFLGAADFRGKELSKLWLGKSFKVSTGCWEWRECLRSFLQFL